MQLQVQAFAEGLGQDAAPAAGLSRDGDGHRMLRLGFDLVGRQEFPESVPVIDLTLDELFGDGDGHGGPLETEGAPDGTPDRRQSIGPRRLGGPIRDIIN